MDSKVERIALIGQLVSEQVHRTPLLLTLTLQGFKNDTAANAGYA